MTDDTTKFCTRFKQACDDNATIPEYGKGRQVVIADRLNVSQEAVRKWFSDEAMPKKEKMKQLANFLGVDYGWLALGVKPEMTPSAKKMAAREAEGAVLVVAGIIQLAGGNCAFPSEDDPRRDTVDIYAIIKGRKIDISVSTAREVGENTFEVVVPRLFAGVRCFAYIKAVGVMFNLVELPQELIEKHKVTRAGDYSLTITRVDGRYLTGDDEWPKLKANGGII